MKKFFRKILIYLVMTMMVTPTWLVTGMMSAEKAEASEGNPRVLNYSLNGALEDVYFASKSPTASSVNIFVEADRAVKFNRLNVLSGEVVAKYFAQTSDYSTTISKYWDGKLANEDYAPDGIYELQVKMTDQSEPPLTNGEGELLPANIIIDNTVPTVESFLTKSMVFNAGQSGILPITFSEVMNQSVEPTIGFSNLELLNNIDLSSSAWINPQTYNLRYKIADGLENSIAPSTIVVNGAKDLAGNIQTSYETTYTVSVDVVAPEARIVSPVELSRVRGVETIEIEADEEITSDCSLVLSLNESDWTECFSNVTKLNDVPGFLALPDGPFHLYAAVVDLAGNAASSRSKVSVELIKDTHVAASVTYSTTNPTNKPVTATLASDESLIVLNNEGSNKHTFNSNGSFTFLFEDTAGNSGSATATVENIAEGEIIASPQIVTTVKGKSINISWSPITNAVSYIVYSSPKAAGFVSDYNKGVSTNVGNVTGYVLNVSDYGEYYVTVTSLDQYGNESSFLNEFTGQKLVTVSAPPTVPTPPVVEQEQADVDDSASMSSATPPVGISAPIANAEENVNENEDVNVVPEEEDGKIKGDETETKEENKVNWTPWIVLFVLILLAGAATGGYFYWFSGEDEVSAVVREKKEIKSTPLKESTKSKANKKSKRW